MDQKVDEGLEQILAELSKQPDFDITNWNLCLENRYRKQVTRELKDLAATNQEHYEILTDLGNKRQKQLCEQLHIYQRFLQVIQTLAKHKVLIKLVKQLIDNHLSLYELRLIGHGSQAPSNYKEVEKRYVQEKPHQNLEHFQSMSEFLGKVLDDQDQRQKIAWLLEPIDLILQSNDQTDVDLLQEIVDQL